MGRQSLVRRGPSGDYVSLSWSGAQCISEVAGVRFAGGSVGRGFQIQPLGAHDFAMEHLSEGVTSRRLLVGRREVKIGTAGDGSSTTATLLGRHHELMTVFQGPAPSDARISELFGVLDIDDDKDGMRVVPAAATMLTKTTEHLVFVNEDSTSMDVPGPAHADQIVPKRAGEGTKHGEVWRAGLPGRSGKSARDFSYVVGTTLGAAEIQAGTEQISDADLLSMVDSVNVRWSKGDR